MDGKLPCNASKGYARREERKGGRFGKRAVAGLNAENEKRTYAENVSP
jgi:hypothetical protein